MRKAALVLLFLIAVANCAPTPEIDGVTSTDLNTTTPDLVEGTAVLEVPQSLVRQADELQEAGYTVQEMPEEIQLVNQEGQAVLRSTEAATITITTKNGEVLVFPQESFEVRETIGAGVESILTVKLPQGEVEYFLLDKTGEWVKPLELQTDAREIENYPQIDLEDVWNGRALYSELLNAQPFPTGTIVPDALVYNLRHAEAGFDYQVELRDIVNGLMDNQIEMREIINKNNDYRRWVFFYRSQTPEGKDVIIGTEQKLMPDGKTSLFLHYVFGPEWPWEENINRFGRSLNLIDSVFLAKTIPQNENEQWSRELSPIVYVEYGDFTGQIYGDQVVEGGGAGEELYKLEQNNPVLISPDLLSTIHTSEPNVVENQGVGFVGVAGEEVQNLQYMNLFGITARTIYPDSYFQ